MDVFAASILDDFFVLCITTSRTGVFSVRAGNATTLSERRHGKFVGVPSGSELECRLHLLRRCRRTVCSLSEHARVCPPNRHSGLKTHALATGGSLWVGRSLSRQVWRPTCRWQRAAWSSPGVQLPARRSADSPGRRAPHPCTEPLHVPARTFAHASCEGIGARLRRMRAFTGLTHANANMLVLSHAVSGWQQGVRACHAGASCR